jgi:hypothetical protein
MTQRLGILARGNFDSDLSQVSLSRQASEIQSPSDEQFSDAESINSDRKLRERNSRSISKLESRARITGAAKPTSINRRRYRLFVVVGQSNRRVRVLIAYAAHTHE